MQENGLLDALHLFEDLTENEKNKIESLNGYQLLERDEGAFVQSSVWMKINDKTKSSSFEWPRFDDSGSDFFADYDSKVSKSVTTVTPKQDIPDFLDSDHNFVDQPQGAATNLTISVLVIILIILLFHVFGIHFPDRKKQ